MQLHYGDKYDVSMQSHRSGLDCNTGFGLLNQCLEGYDITPTKVMDMVENTRGCAGKMSENLQSALAELSIVHSVCAFSGPGQEYPVVSDDIRPYYYIVFSEKKPTWEHWINYINRIPVYKGYKIKDFSERHHNKKAKSWHISAIYDSKKEVSLSCSGSIIAVNPYNFKVVHSDLPEVGGDLFSVLEKIMTPVQFIQIPPVRREEFFGPKR